MSMNLINTQPGNFQFNQKLIQHLFRIVRNKAAEKAKISGYGGGSPLPPETALRHPAYSINGILGIPQTDGNGNINKRKRDDDGKLGCISDI